MQRTPRPASTRAKKKQETPRNKKLANAAIVGAGALLVAGLGVAGVQWQQAEARSAEAAATYEPAVAPVPTKTAAPKEPYTPPKEATLMDVFDGSDGAPGEADTGQEWQRTGSSPLVLTGAGMTVDKTGTGYTFTDLGKVPTNMGAKVVFEEGGPDAVIALIVSAGPDTLDLGNMGIHYVFDQDNWTLQVREDDEEPFPIIAKGSFIKPLTTDGETEYTVNIAIDGDKVTMTHADGRTSTVRDPRVSDNLSGVLAWEVKRPEEAQARPIFKQAWAN